MNMTTKTRCRDVAFFREKQDNVKDEINYEDSVASSQMNIRMLFLRKVYGILSVQLIVTTVVAAAVAYNPVLRDAVPLDYRLLVNGMFASIGLLILLHISRREFPINLVLLGLFTLVEAMTMGVVIRIYDDDVIVKAFTLTFIITTGLTAYTFQTKHDFTKTSAGVLVFFMIALWLAIMNIFFNNNRLKLIVAGVSVLVYCYFIIYDTQKMMKKMSPDDYILAIIKLYWDILCLFDSLRHLFDMGERKSKLYSNARC